jgi:hypothetical protein
LSSALVMPDLDAFIHTLVRSKWVDVKFWQVS